MNSTIANPKRRFDKNTGQIFPYYAGFSKEFAVNAIHHLDVSPGAVVLDPWNGAGTTTTAATEAGILSIGVDLNPAMVVIAKAQNACLNGSAIFKLAQSLLHHSTINAVQIDEQDSLKNWYSSSAIVAVRSAMSRILNREYPYLRSGEEASTLDEAQSVALLALFRVLKRIYKQSGVVSSNPTWIKVAGDSQKSNFCYREFSQFITDELFALSSAAIASSTHLEESKIYFGDSRQLLLPDQSIGGILTSPPYCTRIDYAVKTAIELATLLKEDAFNALRRNLIGTTTVEKKQIDLHPEMGESCIVLLDAIYKHKTKASHSYYYKNLVQYFDGLSQSVSELSRVLKPRARCIVVVQDSFYKEIRISLHKIFQEMAAIRGLYIVDVVSFDARANMVNLNSASKKYRNNSNAREHVLIFQKG